MLHCSMAYKNQISITADSGVGSTTTSKHLHSLLGVSPWRWVNAGAIMRTFANEKGMTIEEFGRYSLEHPEENIDKKCDDMIKHFAEQDYVIFEGRLVHFFAPGAFHVKLVCDPNIRAKRRAKDFPGLSREELLEKIKERDKINTERYKKVYGEDVIWDESRFDLVLDTSIMPPEEIAKKILEKHEEWLSKNKID